MNCAVPWGVFTGKHVELMELVKKVKVRGGDALFLKGDYNGHKRQTVLNVREWVVFFTNKYLLTWYNKAKSRDRRHKTDELRRGKM